MQTYRFSGHDTFHCKESWLLKGVQYVENKNDPYCFRRKEAIAELGVGKNMVRSIQYWLKSFALIDENDSTDFAKMLFFNQAFDPYLEDEGTLWLLQYMICHKKYASIFKLIFSDYFSDKVNTEFSESQIIRFLNQSLKDNEQKMNSEKTLRSDFKVFINTYVSPVRNEKTVEDDFNVPLLNLNLISNTGRLNEAKETVYQLNKINNLPSLPIFIYCLLTEFEAGTTINFEIIRETVGSYLCLSNDDLDSMLYKVSEITNKVVYKSDAGIRQVQINTDNTNLKNKILKDYYEI